MKNFHLRRHHSEKGITSSQTINGKEKSKSISNLNKYRLEE